MASLLDLSKNISSLTKPTRSSFLGGSSGRTQYEEEMRRFVEPAKEEEIKKRNRRTFWNVITDILQIGNYASANVMDSIIDTVQYNKPLGEAAWDAIKSGFRGLTLQDKNTFSDIIRQNAEEHGEFLGKTLEEWEKPLWGDVSKGKTKVGKFFNTVLGNKNWAQVGGFMADIALDPFTYLSPLKALRPTGMASKGAKAAATTFADDMTRFSRLQAGLGDLQGMGKIGREGIEDIAGKTGRGAARQFNLDYKKLYKEGLTSTPEKLQTRAGAAASQVQDLHLQMTIDEVGESYLKMSQPNQLAAQAGVIPETAERTLDSLTKSIQEADRYGGAGQRAVALPFFGEVGKGIRKPNVVARGVGRVTDLIKSDQHGVGRAIGRFADAWSSKVIENPKSPVAMLKNAFGVRNPYQQYLNVIKRGGETIRDNDLAQMHRALTQAAIGLGEGNIEKARSARAILAQVEQGMRKGVGQAASSQASLRSVFGGSDDFVYQLKDVLKGADSWDATIKNLAEQGLDTKIFEDLKALNISKVDADKIVQFWEDVDPALKMMRDKEVELIKDGIFTVDQMGEIKNYLPGIRNKFVSKRAGKMTGSPTPGAMLTKKTTTRQAEREGVEMVKTFFGDWIENEAKETGKRADDIAREIMVAGNFSPLETDLIDMLNSRITAHARMMGRGEIIKQFRELGISEEMLGMSGKAGSGMQHMGDIFNKLEPSSDPALKGLMFDADVKDIVDKTYALMASDDAMSAMKKMFMNMQSWWKGTATATTGFHMRNHFSNNITGFFRHGMRWFNPKLDKEAMAAVQYALHPTRYADILTKEFSGMNEGWVTRVLAKEYNGVTLKHIAEQAVDDGVVSLHTRLGNVTKKSRFKVPIGERAKPWKQEFALPALSRQAGSYIENHARMKSYMLTMGELGKSGVGDTAARNFARLDTKKWFIDYGDLTEFEQQHLKGVIPFYTWLRKNLANQIAGLFVMPEAYRLAAKAEDAVSIDEFDYTLIPEYMKQANWLPISQGEEGPTMWWPNFPYADLNKIPLFFEGEGLEGLIPHLDPKAALEEFTASSNPALKTLVQEATGYNMFRKREFLERVPSPLGQVFTDSPKVIAFVDNAMKAIGFENGAGISERSGRLEIDERLEQIMSSNIPLLKAFGKIFDLGLDITGLEEAVESATGRKDQYEGMEDLFQNLSYFAGAKFREEDEAFRAGQLERQIREAAEKDRSAWKRTLPGYEQRSMANRRQYKAQSRRMGL